MENLGYRSYDVALMENRRFVMPAEFRPAFQGKGKFIIFSDITTRTLIITDEKTFDGICETSDADTLMTFNAREYDPKNDPQARGAFSASQMVLLGNPEEVTFASMDKYIVVSNPDVMVVDKENVAKEMKNIRNTMLGR
jgi:hypothetical protein